MIKILIFMSFFTLFSLALRAESKSSESLETLLKRIEALEKRALVCQAGTTVKGEEDRWSPYSQCPEGYTATGLARVDIIGDHQKPNNHVNDFQCNDQGCRAWCIGGACTVQARCCR